MLSTETAEEEEDTNADLFEGLLDNNEEQDQVKGATAAPPSQPAKTAKAGEGNSEELCPLEGEGEECEEEEEGEESAEMLAGSGVKYDHLHQVC